MLNVLDYHSDIHSISHSFIFTKPFIHVRVAVDQEPIAGTLDTRLDNHPGYTLVHFSVSCTHIHTFTRSQSIYQHAYATISSKRHPL